MADTGQDAVHQRLLSWAQWVSTGGTAVGYPMKSVLHESWLPPAPGSAPTMRVSMGSDKRERETHRAIAQLCIRLRNTVVAHYCHKVPLAEQATRLDCQPTTVEARVREARTAIGVVLNAMHAGV